MRERVIAALPYSLTPSQQRAVSDIVADLAQPHRMLRLLHGDVGSGKTVVALLAAATVIEAGRQAALMAPTEILARQHFATIAPLAAKAGIRVAILTSRERGRDRPEIIAESTHSSCFSVRSRKLPRSESPTSSAPVSTVPPTSTPSITGTLPRQWKSRLRRRRRKRDMISGRNQESGHERVIGEATPAGLSGR